MRPETGFADNTGAWSADITLTPVVDHFLIATTGSGLTMCSTEDQKTCLQNTTYTGNFESDSSKLKLTATFAGANLVRLLTVVDPDNLKDTRRIYVRS
jgi:hypothetical protein